MALRDGTAASICTPAFNSPRAVSVQKCAEIVGGGLEDLFAFNAHSGTAASTMASRCWRQSSLISCWLASTSSVTPYLVRSAVSFGASRQSCPSASLAGMSEAGHQAARVACHHRDGLRYSLVSESLPGSNDPKHPNRPSFCRSTCAESAQSRRRCGRGEISPGTDAAGASPVPAQMWKGSDQSQRGCGRGESSPGADVAGVESGPGADVAAASPVPLAQMRDPDMHCSAVREAPRITSTPSSTPVVPLEYESGSH